MIIKIAVFGAIELSLSCRWYCIALSALPVDVTGARVGSPVTLGEVTVGRKRRKFNIEMREAEGGEGGKGKLTESSSCCWHRK